MTKPTRPNYYQYLLTTRVNYTLTHYADPCERFSHDQQSPHTRAGEAGYA